MPEPTKALPEKIVGYLSVRAGDGKSVLQHDDLAQLEHFRASPEQRDAAKDQLLERGFEILTASDFGFSVIGSSEHWKDLGGVELTTFEETLYARPGRARSITQIGFLGRGGPVTGRIPRRSDAGRYFDAVVIERPRAVLDASPAATPPQVDRFHLRVPADIATILSADDVHRREYRGRGVTVAMVDTGWWPHPFFEANHYNVAKARTVIPDTDPNADPHGHGTGESANIFAVAPEATLLPIRAATDKGDFVGGLAGFMLAKELLLAQGGPGVISNSWGGDYPSYPRVPGLPNAADRMLEIEIRDAIAKGIVVVFSAGNGSFGMEAQVPGVIAAGGVYADAGWQLQATPYTSGYRSPWYEEGGQPVTVPTVSGLVGLPPRASYIMLPIPAGCRIDAERAAPGRDDPPDGTSASDGWALFSGTSAAAPQVAGAVAVLRAIDNTASPAQIRELLCDTALDVRTGRCHPRFDFEATVGPDLATGAGLVNLKAAVARWVPMPPEEPVAPRMAAEKFPGTLVERGLMVRFLQLLATDDGFREAMERDSAQALEDYLDYTGPVDLETRLELAPKRICAAALRDYEDGEPFDVSDETVRLTLMLS
jgi:hypothetical protein